MEAIADGSGVSPVVVGSRTASKTFEQEAS